MKFLSITCILFFTVSCQQTQEKSKSFEGANQEKLAPFSNYNDPPQEAVGLTVEIKTTVDLAKEIPNPDGRILRMRHFKLAPGGKVPLHSHVDRPAVYYIISGVYTEYRSDLVEPRVLYPGDFSPEWGGYSHWVENRSKTDTLKFTSADVFNEYNGEKLTYEEIRKLYGLDPTK